MGKNLTQDGPWELVLVTTNYDKGRNVTFDLRKFGDVPDGTRVTRSSGVLWWWLVLVMGKKRAHCGCHVST